ncbi:MAG: polysaccharide biosynthesis C-terminal domain-containing protein [Clostridia bacterium]|nr:polysaccharide biosynthesis C-terminal domain-containing protein [Clostridia bacterium]
MAKKPSFMLSVITIVCSQLLVKLLGFAYRTIITNIDGFGDLGNGYYNYGFQIYTLLLAVSSVGIPNAIAKLVSEKDAVNDFRGAMRIFKVALVVFTVIGGALSCLLYFGAEFVANVILVTPPAVYTIRVLAPSILFVSVASVIRGFFAGQQNMNATGSAQVMEQFLKSSLTILIVISMTGKSAEYMAAGATLVSLLYLWIFTAAHRKDIKRRIMVSVNSAPQKFSVIAKAILAVSIPISLSSIISSLNRVVDTMTVVRGLETAFRGILPDAMLNENAVTLSGMLSKGDVIINLPLALNFALSAALVPAIAAAMVRREHDSAARKISLSLLVSIVVALPAAAGCAVLSKQIFALIYPNAPLGFDLFAMSAVTIFFSAVAQTTYGSLQGIGRIFIPAISVLMGGMVKVLLNLILIPLPAVNIYGAPISSIACQCVACTFSVIMLRRSIAVPFDFVRFFLKPLLATGIMSACVFAAYKGANLVFSGAVATLAAILVGVVVYCMAIVKLRTFTRDELMTIPLIKKFIKP